MHKTKDNVIVEKSIKFALSIIKYSEVLEKERKFVIARQLLRSGTSVGANIHEAQHAESKADFVHKMKVAVKEASETHYWLTLCEQSETYTCDSQLKDNLDELIRILSKIIVTAKGC